MVLALSILFPLGTLPYITKAMRSAADRDLPPQIIANIQSAPPILAIALTLAFVNMALAFARISRYLLLKAPLTDEDLQYLADYFANDERAFEGKGCAVVAGAALSLSVSMFFAGLRFPTHFVLGMAVFPLAISILLVIVAPKWIEHDIVPLGRDLINERRSLGQTKRLLSFNLLSKTTLPIVEAVFLVVAFHVGSRFIADPPMEIEWPSASEQVRSFIYGLVIFLSAVSGLATALVVIFPLCIASTRESAIRYLAAILVGSLIGLFVSVALSIFVTITIGMWWNLSVCSKSLDRWQLLRIIILSIVAVALSLVALIAMSTMAYEVPWWGALLFLVWGALYVDGLSGSMLDGKHRRWSRIDTIADNDRFIECQFCKTAHRVESDNSCAPNMTMLESAVRDISDNVKGLDATSSKMSQIHKAMAEKENAKVQKEMVKTQFDAETQKEEEAMNSKLSDVTRVAKKHLTHGAILALLALFVLFSGMASEGLGFFVLLIVGVPAGMFLFAAYSGFKSNADQRNAFKMKITK